MTHTHFPIIDNDLTSVPFALMIRHGAAALVNHGQTLAQLASKGGVGPAEAVAIIEDRRYMPMPLHVAREQLREYARQFEVRAIDDVNRTVAACKAVGLVRSNSTDSGVAIAVDTYAWSPASAPPAIAETVHSGWSCKVAAVELATRMRDNPASQTRYNFNKLLSLMERA